MPTSDLNSKFMPILGLWDALEAADYLGVRRLVTHSPRSGKLLDATFAENRSYLPAVLASKWLFANGQVSFESRKNVSYYLMIMKKPGQIPDNLAAKDYARDLKDLDPETALAVASDVGVPPPKKKSACCACRR